MKKILLTGKDGFFGSRYAAPEGYILYPYGHSELDITNEKEVLKRMREITPDYVLHAAAIADIGVCQTDPELSRKVNLEGSIHIAKGCEAVGAKMIYFSSDQVYSGNPAGGPHLEDAVNPANIYSEHKFASEQAIAELSGESVSIRLTWMFSFIERKKQTNPNIIMNIVRAAAQNKPVRLGKQDYRGITYVYDLIQNMEKIMKLPGGSYNIGNPNEENCYEIGKYVCKQLGLTHRIRDILPDTDADFGKNKDLRIDVAKAEHYGIHFSNTRDAVTRCIRDFGF